MRPYRTTDIRPYEVLCLFCHAGGGAEGGAQPARLQALLRVVHDDPAAPLRLRCNVRTHYDFQNPGHAEDTAGGTAFNTRRDLEILRLLGLVPGDARPAWELLRRVVERVPDVAGLCAEGCPLAGSGRYARGIAAGVAALIPVRTAAEMAAVKAASAQTVLEAEQLEIRPHHLMCMACFHGGRAALAPLAADNLYEAVLAVQRNPDIPITLVEGPCMICPPCPQLDASGRCVRSNAMALRDEKKDLDLLARLGLRYGDTLPAGELFHRLFAEIASTTEICGSGDGAVRGWEWAVCGGPTGNAAYPAARAAGLGITSRAG